MPAFPKARRWLLAVLACATAGTAASASANGADALTPFADEVPLIERIAAADRLEAERLARKLAAVRFRHARRLSVIALRNSDERYLRLALLYAESSTVLDPKQAEHWALLGSLYAGLGELAIARLQAEQALSRALDINPDLDHSRHLLAKLLLIRGSYHDAARHLQLVNDQQPRPELPGQIAAAYLADRNYQPGSPTSRVYCATTLKRRECACLWPCCWAHR